MSVAVVILQDSRPAEKCLVCRTCPVFWTQDHSETGKESEKGAASGAPLHVTRGRANGETGAPS
jgi:hypothetical protein